MPAEESKLESFDESVNTIAEKIRTERKKSDSVEQAEESAEQQREAEINVIRNELRESYGDTGGSGDNDDDGEEGESAADLQPANTDEAETKNYLETVPEKYKEPIRELLQTAVQGGIVQAVAKVGKKNNPYVVDVFHDSLAQFLHQRMQDQGLL